MHSAPAVHYPVGRSHLRRTILVLPCFLSGVVGFYWLQAAEHMGPLHGLAVLLWLMACLLTLREEFGQQEGFLHWDGQQWSRDAAAGNQVGVPRVRLDFQYWLLLEFRSDDGRSVWLWPDRKVAPQRWDALRRALYAGSPAGGVAWPGQAGRKAHS
jgi:hypothetical protein